MKDLRTSLIQVLGLMMSKYGYSLSCRLKIVQSLKHFEHLAAPLAEAVEKLTIEFQCRTLVMDVVREITRLDSKGKKSLKFKFSPLDGAHIEQTILF